MIDAIVVGCGEVGQAIYEAVAKRPDVNMGRIDPPLGLFDDREEVDFLHICLRHTPVWLAVVNDYVRRIRPAITIIHSTVPIGTTRGVAGATAHVPIRGKHPNIAPHLFVYEMFVGAADAAVGERVCEYLRGAGIPALYAGDTNTTELAKLLCTTQYAIDIAVAQELRRICEHFGVDYEIAVTRYNRGYNEGIERVGMAHLRRPILFPGFIGGHCLMPNLEILESQYASPLFDFVEESNELRRREVDARPPGEAAGKAGRARSARAAPPERPASLEAQEVAAPPSEPEAVGTTALP